MSLLYIWVALLSASTLGMVTVLDKRLASYNLPSLSSFYVGVAFSLFLYGTVGLVVTGIPAGAPLLAMVSAGVSGLCWGGALAMMFWGYKLEEASRASAIIHTFPVWVAILGVVFLGETLSGGQWAAILVVVAGACVISMWGTQGGMAIRLNRALPILLGASGFTALGLVSGKYALDALPIWFVFSLRNYGMAIVLGSLWRPGAVGELVTAIKDWRTLLILFLAEFALAPLAVWFNVAAISLGPVALVATVTATRPLFVFLYGTLLSTKAFPLLEEPLDVRVLGMKLAATVMVVGGIAGLNML